MIDEENPTVRLGVFGKQVEMFLESEIGEYLRACAAKDIDEATEALKAVDPEDPKAIRALQFKVRVASAVIGWIADAIESGKQAVESLRESP